MRKSYIVLLTIATELIALFIISKLITLNFIDTLFLGGLGLFGVVWLFSFSMTQQNNVFNASMKGITGQKTGGIKVFRFNINPITLGLLIFCISSFIITMIYYSSYFIGQVIAERCLERALVNKTQKSESRSKIHFGTCFFLLVSVPVIFSNVRLIYL